MLPWLIGVAIVGLVVVACWDEIVSWLKDFIPKVKAAFQELKKNILHACAVFVQRVRDAVVHISHKTYYKENKQWMERTYTREISENELPPSIKRKLYGYQEEDITPEMEEELQMTI